MTDAEQACNNAAESLLRGIIDSHCHLDRLDLTPYGNSLDAALDAARNVGVSHFLCVSVDMNNCHSVLQIAHTYPDVSASVGLHPAEQDTIEPSLDDLLKLASDEVVIAIGETGLDYYHVQGDRTWQQERFRCHIRAARELGKPLIIHTREASEDTIRILKEEKAHEVGGVMHCFTETLSVAKQAMELGFYISFSGIITFKNATDLQSLVKHIPLDRMLIETDSPYLAPMPYRGKPNEPAYVKYVAEKIAELLELDYAIIAKATSDNFYRLFC
ncbi:MAG: TatD family hydrolase [Legionellales bacterium]|nr:TatD family hydrolase [Legionellales bacterium]